MKKSLTYILFSFILCACNERYKTKIDVSELIPEDYNTVLIVNSTNELKELLNSNTPFNELKDFSLTKVEFLNTNNPLYVSVSDSSFTFITKYSDQLIPKDSTIIKGIKKTDDKNIHYSIYNKDTIYHNIVDDFYFGSPDYRLVKNFIKTDKPQLKKLLTTTSKKSIGSLIFKNKSNNDLLFKTENLISKKGYELIDINSDGDGITFNGVTKSSDSLSLINAFKNTIPQEFKLAEIIPSNVSNLTRIGFDDFSSFIQNLKNLKATESDSISEILNLQNEIALIETQTGKAIAMHALDADILEDVFSNNSFEENFRDISIFKIKNNSIFKNSIAPFITFENASFGFIFDNFSVFSDHIETLKTIISFKLNNKTLATSEKFQFIKQHLAANSSILTYKDGEGLYNFLNRSVKGYNANTVQYVYDSDFAHINGVLQKYKKRSSSNSITEDFSTSVTADIMLSPQLVKNHRNNSYEIVAQDTNNILYLVSSSGSILWKKQLSGPILGKIEQIDIYKNGRLQLVFATPNRVYVIDRNGKDVGPFPKKFNDKITQPLSVFDYDNQKNYRLLVTQNKSLLMLNASAKRVTGFTYKKAQNTINSQPKHFRIGSKDYIVFSHGQKLEILNRQGKERVNAKKGVDFSENEIFIYKNKFTTLNKNGQLIQVDTKGRVSVKNLDLDINSKITTTSKTLVAHNENKLKIKSKTIDLDYGSYTSPEIFYLNDKIYVSITDLQSKKVYIFDSQGKLLPNFPVFGTASAKLQNLDRKRGLELVTQADEKTILVYKIN